MASRQSNAAFVMTGCLYHATALGTAFATSSVFSSGPGGFLIFAWRSRSSSSQGTLKCSMSLSASSGQALPIAIVPGEKLRGAYESGSLDMAKVGDIMFAV